MNTFVIGDIHGRRAQLRSLIELIPRNAERDTLVFLGDLIDRGTDAPGVVADVIETQRANPERVIALRGNHEQMLIDCVEEGTGLWLSPAIGGQQTFEQYTGCAIHTLAEGGFDEARKRLTCSVPPEHLEFFRQMPHYHEDDYAIYVHAGLMPNTHPRDTNPHDLLWMRDMEFYKNYHGKPCVFGHTPTQFLPLRGRLGRHGIYIHHSAIGLDTGYDNHSPLSCLQLPDFHLYQAFADGHTETYHITTLVPETLRAMRRAASSSNSSVN